MRDLEWEEYGRACPLSSPCLPLELPVGMKLRLGLMGGGGGCPAVLLALTAGGWNELDRKIPSDIGRGLRAGGCGLCAGGRSP